MSKANKSVLLSIGECIRTARKGRELTQEELSERIGVTEQHISNIECGKCNVSLLTLLKITAELGISFDKLLEGLLECGDARRILLMNEFQSLEDDDQETVFQVMLMLISQLKQKKKRSRSS